MAFGTVPHIASVVFIYLLFCAHSMFVRTWRTFVDLSLTLSDNFVFSLFELILIIIKCHMRKEKEYFALLNKCVFVVEFEPFFIDLESENLAISFGLRSTFEKMNAMLKTSRALLAAALLCTVCPGHKKAS